MTSSFRSLTDSDLEELNQGLLNLKKENPYEPTDDESKVLKTCNCNMSRCLKLHCECFQESLYCSDSCACHGCLNRNCYEEVVEIARGIILAGNPLAFDFKDVISGLDSLRIETEEDKAGSSEATSRRVYSCKCKKTACRNRHCQCFKNCVECSIRCQCTGCDNPYKEKSTDGSIAASSSSEPSCDGP